MSEARSSLLELLNAIDRTQRVYKATILHAPAAESGWAPLVDLVDLAATQAVRVMSRIEDDRDGWDAILPVPSPDLSKGLGHRIRDRREALAKEAVIKEWRNAQLRESTRTAPRPH